MGSCQRSRLRSSKYLKGRPPRKSRGLEEVGLSDSMCEAHIRLSQYWTTVLIIILGVGNTLLLKVSSLDETSSCGHDLLSSETLIYAAKQDHVNVSIKAGELATRVQSKFQLYSVSWNSFCSFGLVWMDPIPSSIVRYLFLAPVSSPNYFWRPLGKLH